MLGQFPWDKWVTSTTTNPILTTPTYTVTIQGGRYTEEDVKKKTDEAYCKGYNEGYNDAATKNISDKIEDISLGCEECSCGRMTPVARYCMWCGKRMGRE